MSDQDFFFDEDDQPTGQPSADKTAKTTKMPAAKPKAGGSKAAAPTATAPPLAAQSVSMTVAALIGVCALLLGVIVGIALPVGGSNVPATPGIPSTGAPGGMPGGGTAPQLNPDQLGGELPEGHPPIGEMGGAPGEGETPGEGAEGEGAEDAPAEETPAE